ncbi:MAG: zinc carboxypeptidase [Candidatus Riflebacteria bacterium]|nr:zinc carboxypeptidase [Candidatus Riflebacteria bacterium]
MKRIVLLLVVFVMMVGMTSAWAQEEAKCLVRLSGLESKEMKNFLGNSYDIAARGTDWLEMVVSASEADSMKKAGRHVDALIGNLDEYVKQRLASQTPTAKYHSFEETASTLKSWAAAYPTIVRLESIGKSCEGRDIWAIKLSHDPASDTKKAAVLIMGLTHAREWTTSEVTMAIIETLLRNYGKDARLTRLVDERELWFVPIVNPDGLSYSQTSSKFWRKNRRPISGDTFGVDLNRNYGYHWGESGVSQDPTDDTYPGTAGFTEPETLAIKALSEREKFQASLSFHSYSELVLYPFGYAAGAPNPDAAVFKNVGKQMAAFNKYTVENCTDLYPAAGISDDWLYGTLKTIAFTIEMGKQFIPPATEIASQCAINVPAALTLIEQAPAVAVNSPSGNPAIIETLDFADGISALELGQSMMPDQSGEVREQSASRMQAVARHTAQSAAERILAGDKSVVTRLMSSPASSELIPLVRICLRFESCHGHAVPAEVFDSLSVTH